MSERPFPLAHGAHARIEVRPQHRMAAARSVALCWKGVGHRLLRSLLTLAVIVLAVAFFMTLLSDAAYTHAVARSVAEQQYERSAATRRVATWFALADVQLLRSRLSAAREHPDDMRELAQLAGLPLPHIDALSRSVEDEARLVAYFTELDPGTRALLLGDARPRDLFDYLADEAHRTALAGRLIEVPSLRLPPLQHPGGWRALAESHTVLEGELALVGDRLLLRSQQLEVRWREQLGGSGRAALEQALLAAGPSAIAGFVEVLRSSGFADTGESLPQVQRQLRWRALEREVRDELSTDELRGAWQHAYLLDPPIDEKMRALAEPRAVDLMGTRHPRESLVGLARELAVEARLEQLASTLRQRAGGPSDEGSAPLSGRRRLLLAVSFVVCLVGIANAMFMAITERFREIATMKCLGATDGFILQQFLIEAFLHGSFGGALGALVGAILATVECSVLYGTAILGDFPTGALVANAALALASGIALAMFASLAPAWSASRMAPVDAMRVE